MILEKMFYEWGDKTKLVKSPILSIFCLTYNHAKWIQKALDGFLMQKTEYPWDVVVLDDASTDGTTDIVREYAEKNPEHIIGFTSKKNIYRHPDRQDLIKGLILEFARGKYIALCEGDDYWIDSGKINAQIQYLEDNESVVMVGTASKVLDDSTNEEKEEHIYNKDVVLTDEDIILRGRGVLRTATLMFYKDVYLKDSEYPVADIGDFPLHLYALTRGKIAYLDRETAVYRTNQQGSWSGLCRNDSRFCIKHIASMLSFFNKYNIYTNRKYEDLIEIQCNSYLLNAVFRLRNLETTSVDNILMDILDSEEGLNETIGHIRTAFCRLNGDLSFLEEIKKQTKLFEKIIVFGTGDYSSIVTDLLSKADVRIDGYMVSDGRRSIAEKDGKKVWEFSEISIDPTICIVAGVDPLLWREIEEKFDNANLLTPLWERGK